MSPRLEDWLVHGAGLLVTLAVPLMVIAALCGALAAALGARVGLHDPVVAAVARTLGVAALVIALGAAGWQGLTEFAAASWGQLARVDGAR